MFALSLLVFRYVFGTVSIGAGLILLPMPIPLGIPLILAGVALYAGSTRPIVRGWRRLRAQFSRRRGIGGRPPFTARLD